ncbi:MAG: methylenetetrahydrofolate reductase, partial [Dehalococcoidia bacterium]|nr:methylenetetrahydrofolate reductase [Dehalococcoidia bacterium]
KGLHKQVRIIAGITPLISLAAARYMKMKVPNMDIPDVIIERLRNVRNKEEAAEEGIRIAVETIGQLKQIEGVAGVHLMTLQREELVPKICSAASLYPRP